MNAARWMLSGLAAWACAGAVLAGEVPSQEVDAPALPAAVTGPARGTLIAARRWVDAKGENLVALWQTGEFDSKAEPGARDAELRASLYRQDAGGAWTRVWTVNDHVRDCQVDVGCAFVRGSLQITDLDANQVAEVSFIYRLACVGDISAWEQKLVMVEDGRKYLIRGSAVVRYPDGSLMDGGQQVVDVSFNTAPAPFKAFALRHWRRFRNQSMPLYEVPAP